MDWTSFIPDLISTLFGALIGFGFALWGERILDQAKAKRDASELKTLIREELMSVINDLRNFQETTFDVQPLKIPAWDAVINAGQVSLFDSKTRERLFRVYNTIKEFNSWCFVHTNYYFEKGQENELLINELKRLKAELLGDGSSDKSKTILVVANSLQ